MKQSKSKQALVSVFDAPAPRKAEIGDSLKRLRHERQLTLAQVSESTGVSTSTLSKIENAQVSPSFDVIMRISDGLGIALEDFVRPGRKAVVSGRKAITQIDDGVFISSGQYDYRAHATDIAHKNMIPLEMRIRARSADEFEHWSQHPGEEYVYVLSGEIAVHTEHYAPFRLKAGESAYFDSSMRHVYVTVSRNDARVLSITYDPLHARGDAPAPK
jgi:transcriptional regulator with XRE-family HTH domain